VDGGGSPFKQYDLFRQNTLNGKISRVFLRSRNIKIRINTN